MATHGIFTSSNELEAAVHKATTSKDEAPKQKHVRNVLILTWRTNGSIPFYKEISKRPLDTTPIVGYKAMQLVHKLLQEGPAAVIKESNLKLNFFQALQNFFKSSAERIYSPLNSEYVTFILSKLNFHNQHPEFTGNLSLEEYLKATREPPTAEKSNQLVTHLLDLNEAVLRMQSATFNVRNPRELTECRVAALIPLVIEAYAIYTLTVYFLKKLPDLSDNIDVLSFLIERFYTQYHQLKNFFFESSNIKFVSSIIAVPTLPKDPPQFISTKKKENKPAPSANQQPEPGMPGFGINSLQNANTTAGFTGVTDLFDPTAGANARPGWIIPNSDPLFPPNKPPVFEQPVDDFPVRPIVAVPIPVAEAKPKDPEVI